MFGVLRLFRLEVTSLALPNRLFPPRLPAFRTYS